MAAKHWHWQLWAGFGLSIAALAGYVLWVNETRAVFWPALLVFAVAAVLLFSGLKRRSRQPELYRGKIAVYVLTSLTVLILGLFGFLVYEVSKAFPAAKIRPKLANERRSFRYWTRKARISPWPNCFPLRSRVQVALPERPKACLWSFIGAIGERPAPSSYGGYSAI